MLESCCLSGMFVCDCLHIVCELLCVIDFFLRNVLPIVISIQPKQMTSPRNSNIKNGANNNQEMLLATQPHLSQVTTQFLANNNELDPTMQKFLETQSQLLQRMTNQMINMLEMCPRGNDKCSYYYIFVFMINVYIHAIIVLTRKH